LASGIRDTVRIAAVAVAVAVTVAVVVAVAVAVADVEDCCAMMVAQLR
jgi:hypothetical protein